MAGSTVTSFSLLILILWVTDVVVSFCLHTEDIGAHSLSLEARYLWEAENLVKDEKGKR